MNDNREIPTGLHAHARQTALFVANNATGLLFIGAATQYGVLYDDVRVGLLAYLAGGTLMG